MNESKQDQSTVQTSAHVTAAQLHHHETRFLKALKLLIEAGRCKTTEDLIKYAEQDKQSESANFLRTMAVERVPVDLAYDALSVNLRMVAHKRNNTLIQQCLNRRVGLVLPLPPHVIDAFVSLMPVSILLPDGHHAPLCVESGKAQVVRGSRESRRLAGSLEAVVFEAYRAGQPLLVDTEVSDILDPRLLTADCFLVAHLRPHPNPNDVELAFGDRTVHIL